jgi:hypothetical protein
MRDKSIFNQPEYSDITARISKLTAASQPLWGKMNVGQMLAHCNKVHEQALGKATVGKKPNFLLRFIIRKVILSPKPFKPGLPTGPDFVITDPKEFGKEKQEIIASLEEIYKRGKKGTWGEHPAIGKLTSDEWGYTMWKHLDHHLRQFGV